MNNLFYLFILFLFPLGQSFTLSINVICSFIPFANPKKSLLEVLGPSTEEDKNVVDDVGETATNTATVSF